MSVFIDEIDKHHEQCTLTYAFMDTHWTLSFPFYRYRLFSETVFRSFCSATPCSFNAVFYIIVLPFGDSVMPGFFLCFSFL